MSAELVELFLSLAQVTEEETALLAANASHDAIADIVRDKIRLAGVLDARTARMNRETPQWREALSSEELEALAEAARRLADSAKANAVLLERRISLSEDLILAIEQDHRMRQGGRSAAYCSGGRMQRADLPNPIAINARL